MVDREKVIMGFTRHIDTDCEFCHYDDSNTCITDLCKDVLELLKEQESKWIEYQECLQYDGALDDSYIACSACGHVLNIMDNCTEEFDYCPHCGAKMNGSE